MTNLVDICDGDMKLLDKAVTKFKNKFGFNQNGNV